MYIFHAMPYHTLPVSFILPGVEYIYFSRPDPDPFFLGYLTDWLPFLLTIRTILGLRYKWRDFFSGFRWYFIPKTILEGSAKALGRDWASCLCHDSLSLSAEPGQTNSNKNKYKLVSFKLDVRTAYVLVNSFSTLFVARVGKKLLRWLKANKAGANEKVINQFVIDLDLDLVYFQGSNSTLHR